MQNINKNLLLAILFIALSGCELMGDCTKINIPKHERQWFDNYSNPRKIILLSQYGNTDTITYTDGEWYYTPCNKFELGDKQFENFSVRGVSVANDSRINLEYYSVNKKKDKKGYIYFNNARIDFYDNDINKRATKRYCKYKNDSLNGHLLNYYNADSNDVAIAFWSMELGIIEYETGAGEKFELVAIK